MGLNDGLLLIPHYQQLIDTEKLLQQHTLIWGFLLAASSPDSLPIGPQPTEVVLEEPI